MEMCPDDDYPREKRIDSYSMRYIIAWNTSGNSKTGYRTKHTLPVPILTDISNDDNNRKDHR